MADDGTLRVTAQVNLGALDSLTAKIQTVKTQLVAAQTEQKQAAERLISAQQQLSSMMAAGAGITDQFSGVVEQCKAELEAATVAVRTLGAQLSELTATQAASTAATVEDTAAQESNTAATFSRMEAMGVARTGMGAMTGSMGAMSYGLARIAASSQLLGPALQAALPVVVAGAMVDILVHMGEAVYNLDQKYLSLDAATKRFNTSLDKIHSQDFMDVHSIEEAQAGIEASNDSAEQLQQTVNRLDRSTIWTRLKDLTVVGMLSNMTNQREAVIAQDQASQHKLQAIELAKKEAAYQHQINVAQIETNHAGDAALRGQQRINAEKEKQIQLLAEEQRYTAQISGDPAAGREIEQIKIKGVEERANAEALIAHPAKTRHEKVYDATNAYRILEQVIARMDARELADQEKIGRQLEENARASGKLTHGIPGLPGYTPEKGSENTPASEKHAAILQGNANSLAQAGIEYQRATMKISAYKAAQELATLHTEEFAQAQARLNQQMAEVQASGLSAPEKQAQMGQLQNQGAQQQGNRQVQMVKDASAQAQAFARPWQQAFNTINQSFLATSTGMIQGTESIQMAFQRMGTQIVLGFVTSLEQMLMQWIEHEILVLLIHQQTHLSMQAADAQANAMKNASLIAELARWIEHELMKLVFHKTVETEKAVVTDTAKAQATAIRIAANVAAVQGSAGVAGAAAAAAAAAAGPIAMITAGMQAITITEALGASAAYAKGGIVPETNVALVHKGEMVLPENLSSFVQRSAAQASGNSTPGGAGGTHFHYAPQVSAIDTTGVKDMLEAHQQVFASHMMRYMRGKNMG